MNHYVANTPDWRTNLKRNSHRTCMVITIFFTIYLGLGLLIDLYLYSENYPNVALSTLGYALITFKIIPYATLITGSVACISLWITFTFHSKLILLGAKYHEITADSVKTLEEQQLYNVIEEMKVAAGLRFIPKIFIIDADYMNAFASGYNEKSALVAITRGLMKKLKRDELQAVMAHELSHIRHMDIKLTLMASVLANIMLIIIDVLFYGILFSRNRRSSESGNWLVIIILALRILLPLITVLLMLFLSRTREYMADAGCVELMRTNEPLARALLKIANDHQQHKDEYQTIYKTTAHESVRREAYIFDPVKAGIESKSSVSDWFSTHPSIEKRLAAIGFRKKDCCERNSGER